MAASQRQLANLGVRLYEVLPLSFHQALPEMIQSAFVSERGIRLVLEARAGDRADRLLSLPWELLFYTASGWQFARSSRFTVVRRLLGTARLGALEIRPAFHVVHVIANSQASELQQIEVDLQETERVLLPQLVGRHAYQLVEKPGSIQKLRHAVTDESIQVIHFLGHGKLWEAPPGESGQGVRGYLCFEGEDEHVQPVTGEDLHQQLSRTSGMQMIVLNACDSGAVAGDTIARDLIYNGFPYVVAMQYQISQAAAGHFITAFYTTLKSTQSVEQAVASGRDAIASHLPGSIDWCLPVLYANAGVPDKTRFDEAIGHVEQWFRQAGQGAAVIGGSALFIGAHLTVGLQLWLRGERLMLPSLTYLAIALGWLGLVPPLVSWWTLYDLRRLRPPHWSRSMQWGLRVNVLGAAAIGLGLPISCIMWPVLVWFAGVGLWPRLPSIVQIICLELLALGAATVSIAQARSHGLGFITDSRVGDMPFAWIDWIVVIGGYFILGLPFGLIWSASPWVTAPYVNVFIAVYMGSIAYAWHRQRA